MPRLGNFKIAFGTLVLMTVVAAGYNPPYALPCRSDAQCGGHSTKCFKDYEQCDVGICGCIYGYGPTGLCTGKETGASCSSRDPCSRGLTCHQGRCVCQGSMIDNGAYCLNGNELLMGEKCGSGQMCVYKKDDSRYYERRECENGMCSCLPGLKADDGTCRRLRPNEYGCYSNADCSGDSVCRQNSVCLCPAGHEEVRGTAKCGKIGARANYEEAQNCDELINKDRFCSPGLQCVRCGDDANYKCRKYKSTRPEVNSVADRTRFHTSVLYSTIIAYCLIKSICTRIVTLS